MASTVVVINHTAPLSVGTKRRKPLLRALISFLMAAISGVKKISAFDIYPDGATPVAASGTVTIASGSGSIAAVINGVSIAVTWATSDTATATALAAAINASSNALVQYLVSATSSAGVVTIAALQKGITGNCITLAATGTGATASGARLTGGAGGNVTGISTTL